MNGIPRFYYIYCIALPSSLLIYLGYFSFHLSRFPRFFSIMKLSIIFTAGLVSHAFAYPAIMEEALEKGKQAGKLAKRVLGVNPGFNAAQQLIDVHGSHAWVAPGSRDLRGPCPGLNALANQ